MQREARSWDGLNVGFHVPPVSVSRLQRMSGSAHDYYCCASNHGEEWVRSGHSLPVTLRTPLRMKPPLGTAPKKTASGPYRSLISGHDAAMQLSHSCRSCNAQHFYDGIGWGAGQCELSLFANQCSIARQPEKTTAAGSARSLSGVKMARESEEGLCVEPSLFAANQAGSPLLSYGTDPLPGLGDF